MISHDRSPLSLPLGKSGVVLFMVELYHGIPSMSIGFICICFKFFSRFSIQLAETAPSLPSSLQTVSALRDCLSGSPTASR